MTDISLSVVNERQFGGAIAGVVRPVLGRTFYMRFKTDMPHTDAEASASGINRDLCISWDCLNDRAGQALARAHSESVAATQAVRAAETNGAIQHKLLTMQPSRINSHIVEGGTLNPLDLYFYGLGVLVKSQPQVKTKLLQYLASTVDYEPVGVADNPFDKQDYAASLPKERSNLVDRMLSQTATQPPKAIVIFGYAALDKYDIDSETMSFRSCRDHGSMQHGMYCSNSGLLLTSTQSINERVFQLAQDGSLVSRGKAKPRQFGQYHQRGPIYSISSFGIPQNYTAKVPKEVARALFEMAKGSPLPKYAMDQGFGNKTIGLKIVLENFSPSAVNNASVTYTSTAAAFCFYDYSGNRPVYCADLPPQRR